MDYSFHQRRSLSEQAYNQIRDSIITLEYEPGHMLYEADLGRQLGMSRTPIREAVRLLMTEGLIEVLPQRGMQVSYISESKIEENRVVRESLEVYAFREVSRCNKNVKSWAALMEKATQLLKEQELAATNYDALTFLNLDEKFHGAIMGYTGNRTLMDIVSQMRGHLNRVRILNLRVSTRIDYLIEEHREILHSISEGDEEQTIAKLLSHVRRLKQDIVPLKSKYGAYFSKL